MADDTPEDGAPTEDADDEHATGADHGAGDDTSGEHATGDDTSGEHATGDDTSGEHATGDDAGSGEDEEFARRVEEARDLIGEDATALYVGVVREGREVDSTFAQQADDHQQEGMQALSLLASHIRLVSDEAGVDYTTVAADAVTLAEQLDESE